MRKITEIILFIFEIIFIFIFIPIMILSRLTDIDDNVNIINKINLI